MCLQTIWKEPKQANRNISVFKLMKKPNRYIKFNKPEIDYQSPYNHFNYSKGKVYSTALIGTSSLSAFDEKAAKYCLEIESHPDFKSIGEGFHAAVTKKRLMEDIDEGEDYVIVKCVVPKGSLYYKDGTGLIVSNKIIILGE